jgi:predicted esterase
MEPMDLAEVRRRVFAAYAAGSFQDGLDPIAQARTEHPDDDETLTFWEACLSSMGGDPERALGALNAGLDRGLAWHPKMLADSDLDSARELLGWDEFERRSANTVLKRAEERPKPLVRPSLGSEGTVIALHGGGAVPSDFFSQWAAAVPAEWTLIAPIGDVPRSGGRWAWPYDFSTNSLVEALADQPLEQPIVMAGFSQGAALALKTAWNDVYEVSGLIVVAGMLGVEEWERSAKKPVPLFLVVGTDDDISNQPSKATCAALLEAGVPVHVDLHEGLGHEYPADMSQVVRAALDWINERSGRRDGGTGL